MCKCISSSEVANNPGSCEEWYLGDERDGVRHGHGAAFYTSGDVYLGQVGGDTGSRDLLLLLSLMAVVVVIGREGDIS